MKAFVDIGAARGFADGMKVERAHLAFELCDGFEVRLTLAQPRGQARSGRGLDLDEHLIFPQVGLLKAGVLEIGTRLRNGRGVERSHQYTEQFVAGSGS